jgi:hypothetical protein
LTKTKRKGKSFTSTKKANAFVDTLMIVVFLFIIAVGFVTIYMLYDAIGPEMIDVFNETGHNQSVQMLNTNYTDFPDVWDGVFVFLLFGLWLAAIVGSFFIDAHPIFFVIVIFILVPIIIVGVVLGNSFEEFAGEDTTSFIQTDFPMTYQIMSHMLPIAIVVGLSIAMALYAKNKFI